DAGCGTGLCGPLLAPYCQRLDGVDLSPKMLEKAKSKQLYDRLSKAELTAFLNNAPDMYDVIIAADVLCYFGDLSRAASGFLNAL
ncbi:methyltransferase, partial [bacterium LRH843]|nr:methyltransferase [bacterium LRH843]